MGRFKGWRSSSIKKLDKTTLDKIEAEQENKQKEINKRAKEIKRQLEEEKKKQFVDFCIENNLPKPIIEYMFAQKTMKRKWRIDYFFELNDVKVGLEIEGGTWTKNSRHTHIGGYQKDIEKYNAMAEHGIFLLRITPQDLFKNETMESIKKVLKNEKRKKVSD